MKKKVLIFIVAYNAQRHIEKVLDRIPKSVFENYNYEILIIDDASKDKTFEVANHYQYKNGSLNLKILYNPDNQGYGGNQKLGYHYAIINRFDVVVLLHGDGQYAPEVIEQMFVPILKGEADAVFGSRMMIKGAALKGRMPLYKYVGNKVLTFIQNKILDSRLTEYHSGYRAYSTKALENISFQFNSNDFHFDTQIIIQLLLKKLKIVEIPIPTYYGDEICHVNGIKYAWDVIISSIKSKLHQLSIMYQREYDSDQETTCYTPKLGYPSSHTYAIQAVRGKSRVLDLGCNEGEIALELKKKGCTVYGVDFYPVKNKDHFDEFKQINLNDSNKLIDMDTFDYILLLDIIEHLDNPEAFMYALRERTKRKQPTLILTTPNIAFGIIRFQLLMGHFNYGKQGILDLTHKRLFTFKSIRKLCVQAGYKINKVTGIPVPFPKALGDNILSRFLLAVNRLLIVLSKGMFSYQIYIEATPLPLVNELLDYTITESAKRAKKIKKN